MHDMTLGLGEAFTIDGIEVRVVDVQSDRVRLGITAPRTVPVHRKEVYLAIKQKEAGQPAPAPSANKEPQ